MSGDNLCKFRRKKRTGSNLQASDEDELCTIEVVLSVAFLSTLAICVGDKQSGQFYSYIAEQFAQLLS